MRCAEQEAGAVYVAGLDLVVLTRVYERDGACHVGCEATEQADEPTSVLQPSPNESVFRL